MMPGKIQWLRTGCLALALAASLGNAQAAIFGDDEARTAINELSKQFKAQKEASDAAQQRASEANARALLNLQGQIDTLKDEVARLRGQDEQVTREQSRLAKELADFQRLNKTLEERLRTVEPQQILVDGRDFVAAPAEKADYDAAMALFRCASRISVFHQAVSKKRLLPLGAVLAGQCAVRHPQLQGSRG